MSNSIMNYGINDFFDAISMTIFSKDEKGLSKIMLYTLGFNLRPWLNIMETDPMERPHNEYLL